MPAPLTNADRKRQQLACQVRQWSVEDFHDLLKQEAITFAYIVFENGEFTLSHSALAPLQAFFELSQDFARHEAVFIGREDDLETLYFAFVHDTRRGLAQGGLRFKPYENLAELLVDGLRLAHGMTRKNALAGLWWGGGKGIMPVTKAIKGPGQRQGRSADEDAIRRRCFEAYGRFVARLRGVYYTAEDIGTFTADMKAILSENRFTTCIPASAGGSGNPSPYTAHGVFRAMQAAWQFISGSEQLTGVRVAVQGAGNVGAPLIKKLVLQGAEVSVCDINQGLLDAIKRDCPGVTIVEPDTIFDLDADIFAPCAIGAQVNAKTIPRLKVKLVCGAANNILKEPTDAERLRMKGITFVPDYLCNRMGIVNCADEWQGYLDDDVRLLAERVFPDTLRVLKHAKNLGITTTQAADELADAAASTLHPLIGHRGRRLIDKVVADHKRPPREDHEPPLPIFDHALDEPALRDRWTKDGMFQGVETGPSVAAMPMSSATGPNLASFLSGLFADIRARSAHLSKDLDGPLRRVLGSDHGGRALQQLIEQSLPQERNFYPRSEFVKKCSDLHAAGDARVRDQLNMLGVGFDPSSWQDPMSRRSHEIVKRLYHTLCDAGVVGREQRLVHHCPSCQTTLVSSDVVRGTLSVEHSYTLHFEVEGDRPISASTHFPELVLGAAALAVDNKGPYADLAGQSAVHPVDESWLPVLGVDDLGTDATFLVPSHSFHDARLLRSLGIEGPPLVILSRDGRLCVEPYPGWTRDETRVELLDRLEEHLEEQEQREQVAVSRCARCESVTVVLPSPELFVDLRPAIGHLTNAINNGAVTFSASRWKEAVLAQLDEYEPWCISRQQWWGHEIPDSPGEVFSTWFSMVAWSLAGKGWPELAQPSPITDLYVDPDLLLRWVLPSQLVSLLVTGRPAFSHVHVHGALNLIERSLLELDDDDDERPFDEARFLFRSRRKAMRRSLGNVVEPRTLIRRFGADALRLGMVLCCQEPSRHSHVASESVLRRARRGIHRLNQMLSHLQEHARLAANRESEPPGLTILDIWLLSDAERDHRLCLDFYKDHRFDLVGERLLEAIDDLGRYIQLCAPREAPELTLAIAQSALHRWAEVMAPVCPFIFEAFTHLDPGYAVDSVFDWLPELVAELQDRREREVALIVTDEEAKDLLSEGRELLAELTRKQLDFVEEIDGEVQVIGPVQINERSQRGN